MRINQYLLHVTSFHFTIKTYLEQRTIFKSKHYTLVFLVSRSSTVFSSVPLGFELDFRFDTKMYTINPPVKSNTVQKTPVTPVNSDFQLFSLVRASKQCFPCQPKAQPP